MPPPKFKKLFRVENYDLAATLNSGQVFRWVQDGDAWTGVVGKHWVRLQAGRNGIAAETAEPVRDWQWLASYLQTEVDLKSVLATFPEDKPMCAAVAACRGLRLLRQDAWECLASFILSSTKQIIQIRQIVALLCESYGDPVPTPRNQPPAFAFPVPERLASVTEDELRRCKMGFRAPHLLAAARAVARGELNLACLRDLPLHAARCELMKLPGVGPKIADCVLLFAYGFPMAFPLDVWVLKALRQLYFPRRHPTPKHLRHFAETHFEPFAGYAQQYLFHYMRTHQRLRSRNTAPLTRPADTLSPPCGERLHEPPRLTNCSHEPECVVGLVRSSAFRRAGPRERGTPNRRFMGGAGVRGRGERSR